MTIRIRSSNNKQAVFRYTCIDDDDDDDDDRGYGRNRGRGPIVKLEDQAKVASTEEGLQKLMDAQLECKGENVRLENPC